MNDIEQKRISLVLAMLLVLITLVFVFIKADTISHIDCEEDHCPICEIIYTTKKCTSGMVLGKSVFVAFLLAIVYLYSKCSIDNEYYAKYKSLIEDKVRIDC